MAAAQYNLLVGHKALTSNCCKIAITLIIRLVFTPNQRVISAVPAPLQRNPSPRAASTQLNAPPTQLNAKRERSECAARHTASSIS
jgi:hypothetical protein